MTGDPSAGGGEVRKDLDGNTIIVPPIFGPPIPQTSIDTVKSRLAARWPISFQQAGPTAYVRFTLPGSPLKLFVGVRGAPDDTSGRVGMLQCSVEQTGPVMNDAVIGFIESCLAPALTDQQRQAVNSWLGPHGPTATTKGSTQRQDLGTAWLYAVRPTPDDFYVRLVGK